MTNLRVLHYSPKGDIFYKLSFGDRDFSELPRRAKNVNADIPLLQPLHNGRLRIKQSKFRHLQELKSVMSPDYHSFYDSLLHE